MRVISGSARGHKLKSLKGMNTRPTADRIKESLFNMIADFLNNAHILDLFAGTGNLGIESLSRGGQFAVFIDKSSEAVEIIKQNLIHTKLTEKAKVYHCDYSEYIHRFEKTQRKFDIIFMDPPYSKGFIMSALEKIRKKELLSAKGIIVVERESHDKLPEPLEGFEIIKERSYGRTVITIINFTQYIDGQDENI
ncbi:MAG: 16S rRNA (guanine(966)-N(2))-methyltransferase RsmD [Clostridia bacterium]